MKMKKFVCRYLLVVYFLLITGCSSQQKADHTFTPVFSEWVNRFFEETACQLPCWEGITPGKTTIEETRELLELNALFSSIEGPILINEEPKKYEILWKGKEGTAGGLARSLGDKNFTWVIYLSLTRENPKITLGEFISVFGEPDSLIIEEDRGICTAKLFYKQKAMALVLSDPCHLKMSIRKNEKIESIRLFPIGISSFPEIEYFQSNILIYLLNWNGFGRYPITKIIKLE